MKMQNGLIAAAVVAAMSVPAYASEVTISGAVEIEASSVTDNITPASDPTAPEKTTDIVLATAAVGLEAQINNRLSATLAFLYEEDDAAFDGASFGLDEATLSLKLGQNSVLTAGRMFVPFGSFDSFMISDPYTMELGETSETALMLSTEDRGVSAAFYAFKGDVDEITTDPTPDDNSLSYGANIGYSSGNLWMGASYISNIAETDFLQDISAPSVADAVAGYGANFGMKVNNTTFLLEWLTADDFANNDTLAEGTATVSPDTDEPSAINAELAFALRNGATFAVAYQTTAEARFLGLPEIAISAAYTMEMVQGASLGLEYASIEDYSAADGGSGKDATAITVQLAVEF